MTGEDQLKQALRTNHLFRDLTEAQLARIVGAAGGVPNDVLNDFADFGSYHPFGANFAMGDGAVRMISDEIELSVYHALATREGGEVIPSP